MRILVVDDSEDGREIAETMLNSAGYSNVALAGSAAEAFDLLDIGGTKGTPAFEVDIVLLDIVMPSIDGIEACARIRKDPRYRDLPIIMVTSLADMDSLANAFVAGATDYITKPMKRVELLARVRSALKLKSELDRRQAREHELLQFMSSWGDRRASLWIDEATGLFVGEVVEAYLVSAANFPSDRDSSVIALEVDRLDAYRTTQGKGVATGILAQVAGAVRATVATVGVVAGAYRNGAIVLILPALQAKPALELAEALRASIAKLGIGNRESIAANHVTVSVAVATGRVNAWIDRVQLLTRAILAVPRIAAAGGDRAMPEAA